MKAVKIAACSEDKAFFQGVVDSPNHEVIETSQVVAGFDEMVSKKIEISLIYEASHNFGLF